MSEQPLTYEGVLELFRETDRRFQETALRFQETERQMKATNRKISALGSRIGEIVENMVRGKIVPKFRSLGYDVTRYGRNLTFENKELEISGEIDLFLEDGDISILIEVKTTLETADVRRHVERMKKYRCYADARKRDGTKRFIGAVAGAVVSDEVVQFAHENGMYAIVQSGRAIEIVSTPVGFQAKEW